MSVIYGWMIFYSATYISARVAEDENGGSVIVSGGRKLIYTTLGQNLPFIAGAVIAAAAAVCAVVTLVRFRKKRCAAVLTALTAAFIVTMLFVNTDIAGIYILRYVVPGTVRNIVDSSGPYSFRWLKFCLPAMSVLFMIPTFFRTGALRHVTYELTLFFLFNSAHRTTLLCLKIYPAVSPVLFPIPAVFVKNAKN